ncbi:MAG: hypothetical protein ACPIOQ_80500, partial [Promethearchaeia archaeon]
YSEQPEQPVADSARVLEQSLPTAAGECPHRPTPKRVHLAQPACQDHKAYPMQAEADSAPASLPRASAPHEAHLSALYLTKAAIHVATRPHTS